jgi:Rap1a immunity proteins
MTKILSLCVFMLLAVGFGTAQDVSTGNWLLTTCQIAAKSIDDPNVEQTHFEAFRDGYCKGIVQGIAYASAQVCPAGNVTLGQEVRVVTKYLQDHPEELNQQSTRLVDKALAKAFPCPK